MSLRDLTTSSLCAPTDGGGTSRAAAAASSNPLAQLAEAVLPSTAHPDQSAPSRLRASSSAAHPDAEIFEAHSLRPLNESPEDIPEHGRANFDNPHLPQGLFLPHSSAPVRAPVRVPVRTALPPIPAPVKGDPTDVFERAFTSAAVHTPTAAAPQFAPTTAHQPPFVAQESFRRPPPSMMRPWQDLNSSFAALSLRPSLAQLPQMMFSPLHHAPIPMHSGPFAPNNQTEASNLHQSQQVHNSTTGTLVASDAQANTPPDLMETSGKQSDVEFLSRSFSWGEEFTSLESVEGPLQPVDAMDDFLLDETLQNAFQHWLRRDASDTYHFSNQSFNTGHSAAQALQEGIRAHNEGRLTAAVFYLEDALNRPNSESETLPVPKRALAWYVLGLSLADLDDDERAIQALSQGLRSYDGVQIGHRREDNPYLWQSLIALAVSYTNELENTKALRVIREWMELRKGIDNGDGEAGTAPSIANIDLFRRTEHNDLLNGLSRIANEAPQDADVFVVLGILHNLNRDYGAAAGALRHAVTLRPTTPNLWNKLGATLANGGQSDDALRAYRKAVDLHPALVRAWVNVGTAYSNRGEFAKAMRYYLKAIAMSQETGGGMNATTNIQNVENLPHVWGYLRSTLISLSRGDLLHLVESRDIAALRTHFNY